MDTSTNYKMQFDVTVNGETKTVTDDSFATKSNGSFTKTIDTKTLFGSARRNAKADVKVTLLDDQIDYSAGGQLWAGGILPSNGKFCHDLDCIVVNSTCEYLASQGLAYDTVRGAFPEGDPIFAESKILTKTHVQICVRSPEVVVAYFIPKISD